MSAVDDRIRRQRQWQEDSAKARAKLPRYVTAAEKSLAHKAGLSQWSRRRNRLQGPALCRPSVDCVDVPSRAGRRPVLE
jgi:hypothetical protein